MRLNKTVVYCRKVKTVCDRVILASYLNESWSVNESYAGRKQRLYLSLLLSRAEGFLNKSALNKNF